MPTQRKNQPAKKKQTKKKTPAKKKAAAKKRVAAKKKVAPKKQVAVEEPPKRRFTGDVYSLFAQALNLLRQRKHKQARKQFVRLIEAFSSEIEVIARAQTFLRICDRYLQDQEKDSATTPEEIFNQGVFYHNAGQYDKALEDYSRALKLSKDKDHVYYAIAATEFSMGNTDDALTNLEKAIQLNEENRFLAHNDSDFELLSTNKQFRKLIYPD